MKKFLIFFILYLNIFADLPFHKGVNIPDWIYGNESNKLQFGKYDIQDIKNIKILGADVIRLPVKLHKMNYGGPDFKIDTIFLYFLDKIIDMAEEENINIIIDNHSTNHAKATYPEVQDTLTHIWQNIANHYKNRSKLIFYEILNEPRNIGASEWNKIQYEVIKAIRKVDKKHTIIVGSSNYNYITKLDSLIIFPDSNIIYSFHFYEPFLLTHQGATWTNPSMIDVRDIPFPYDKYKMPQCPSKYLGTWIEYAYVNYKKYGTVKYIYSLLDHAKNFKNKYNVPVYCGEFGVYMPKCRNIDRVNWYKAVTNYFSTNNIIWTMWDYKQGFGIFTPESKYKSFNSDLNIPLLRALGFNIPEQKPFEILPDSQNFMIYTDYIHKNIGFYSSKDNYIDYYNDNSYNDKFCLYWTDIKQHNSINFTFTPYKNLTYLDSISFYVKCKSSQQLELHVRFVDTEEKEDKDDKAWQISYPIQLGSDTNWHQITIDKSKFKEVGALYQNKWYQPKGKFDWTKISTLKIMAYFPDNNEFPVNFFLDNIKIIIRKSTKIKQQNTKNDYIKIYPNPFKNIIFIDTKEKVQNITFFNILGKKIITTTHNIINTSKLSTGIYLIKITYNNKKITKKILKIK